MAERAFPEATVASEAAAARFQAGTNCAQAVYLPFALAAGIDQAVAMKTASAFGAGMGRLQETCGALTGAFMALGVTEGFSDPADQAARARVIGDTRALAEAFKAAYGAMRCRDLLGCDLTTPEGQAKHQADNQRDTICTPCVRFAAEWVGRRLAGES